MSPRLAAVLVALTLHGAACAGGAGESTNEGAAVTATAAPGVVGPSSTTSAPAVASASGPAPGGTAARLSPLAELVRPAPEDLRPPEELARPAGPVPVGLSVPELGLTGAPVRDVGVEPDGEMEVPGATEVGWYRWSPTPGAEGSAVLAAHVAYDGRDGVFRNLADLDVGDRFTVDYRDGSRREFVVTERAQYGKAELPFDRVFARDGDPSVVLITCGGDFNRSLSSYADNVVAYAEPV